MSHQIVLRYTCYLFAIVLGWFSFLVTRGPDGDLDLMIVLFGLSGLVYVVLLVLSSRGPLAWHSIGHFLLYEAFCGTFSGLDTELEEMAGMLPILIIWAVAAMVASGVIANLIVRGAILPLIRARAGRNRCRKCRYDLTGNVSGRCPECGETINREDT